MKCTRLLPSLFIGPDPRWREDIDQLKSLQITAILSLQTAEDRVDGIDAERNLATRAALEFCNVPVTDFDSADLQQNLPQCVRELDELLKAGHTTYLHCTAGVSRSPTVAYLHGCLSWDIERALTHLRAQRDCCPDEKLIRLAQRP